MTLCRQRLPSAQRITLATTSGEGPEPVNEAHFSEIEKVLLYITDARERTARAADELAKNNAEPHLVASLETAESELKELHRRLMQSTYFAVVESPATQDQLAV